VTEFLQVDVFAQGAYRGNQLAVFPDAGGLSAEQMQAIAAEMNLSETTFVLSHSDDSYDVRIFTPAEELPFAGHPTLGTAWVLRHLGLLRSNAITQNSPAGPTKVWVAGDSLWFERTGSAQADLVSTSIDADQKMARMLNLQPSQIGMEAREIGRSGRLRPAYSDAGLLHLMVPLRDLEALRDVRVDTALLAEHPTGGVYCFAGEAAGAIRARGIFPSFGIAEDPVTGSAAACLGIYLADRLGSIELDVHQGVEMGRPSRLMVKAEPGRVEVGGDCCLIFKGELTKLP
jgi:trans-2,3-dihydro-3-hydroxyanthranilate isomerase